MKLLAPDITLLLWTLFSLISLGLMVFAMISLLRNKTLDSNMKLVWTLAILFMPMVGAILFFTLGKQKNIA